MDNLVWSAVAAHIFLSAELHAVTVSDSVRKCSMVCCRWLHLAVKLSRAGTSSNLHSTCLTAPGPRWHRIGPQTVSAHPL